MSSAAGGDAAREASVEWGNGRRPPLRAASADWQLHDSSSRSNAPQQSAPDSKWSENDWKLLKIRDEGFRKYLNSSRRLSVFQKGKAYERIANRTATPRLPSVSLSTRTTTPKTGALTGSSGA